MVLAAGHQVCGMRCRCKRWRVHSVVLAAGGFSPSCKRGVEVIGRSVFPVASRDKPRVALAVDPDCASPALDLHLEQDSVINGHDALMGRLFGELLDGFDQQWVLDLVKGDVGARYRLPEVFAQAFQGGPRPPCHG